MFFIALDDSTDTYDAAQVLLFIRGVNSEFQFIKELAGVHAMETTVTGVEILSEVKETILGLRLVFMKLKGVTSDGVVKHRWSWKCAKSSGKHWCRETNHTVLFHI